MSLPDNLLENNALTCCRACGNMFDQEGFRGRLCWDCRADNADLYADEWIEDHKLQKGVSEHASNL